jgi:hypothetical protein
MTDSTVIEVEDEGVVTIDLPEGEGTEATESEVAVKAEPKPRVRKVAADEAAEALKQAVEKAQSEAVAKIRAAEETAQAERTRAEAAQRLAEQRDAEAKAYKEAAESSELTLLNSGIESETREVASHQAALEAAWEAGEFKKAGELQVKLAKATARLDRLEAAKEDYEAGARKTPVTEGRVEPQIQQSPLEQYLSRMAPRAQAWLRSHPECAPPQLGGDPVKHNAMMKGHYAAGEQKITEGSDDYFRVIEESAGYRQPAAPVSAAAEIVPAERPRRAAPVPAAPVTREPPGSNAPGPKRTYTLTKEQQEAAKITYPHLDTRQAFAKYAEGLYSLDAETPNWRGRSAAMTH